jgi:peptide chain release factor 2
MTELQGSDFLSKVQGILSFFNLEQLKSQKESLERELLDNQTWSDPNGAKTKNQKLSEVQNLLESINSLQNYMEEWQIARELEDVESLEALEKAADPILQELSLKSLLSGRFDKHSTTLSIHSGAGGIDAQDFAAMLASMYQAFCQEQGWTYKIIALSSGEEGGVKSMTLEITGGPIYGYLKEEAGVHRLIRISPFNSGNTRETSFALVEVLPNNLEEEYRDFQVDEKDLRWDFFTASGKGGQSVNKTSSAVRVVHLPTKISATCQNERSQLQNKEIALEQLKNKLIALELKKKEDLKKELKGDLISPEWGSQIRTYTLHPYKMVKDHRSGYQTSDVDDVLKYGNLKELIVSVKKQKKESIAE